MNKNTPKKNLDVFNNKFDIFDNSILKMEFMKQLVELNNKLELERLSKEIFPNDSDDEEEEIEFTNEVKKNFCKQFNKKNNRQFKLIRVNH